MFEEFQAQLSEMEEALEEARRLRPAEGGEVAVTATEVPIECESVWSLSGESREGVQWFAFLCVLAPYSCILVIQPEGAKW